MTHLPELYYHSYLSHTHKICSLVPYQQGRIFIMIDQDLHKASLDTSTKAQLRTAHGNNCVGRSAWALWILLIMTLVSIVIGRWQASGLTPTSTAGCDSSLCDQSNEVDYAQLWLGRRRSVVDDCWKSEEFLSACSVCLCLQLFDGSSNQSREYEPDLEPYCPMVQPNKDADRDRRSAWGDNAIMRGKR